MTTPDKHGWMPIETAPKDGTRILGFGEHSSDCTNIIGIAEIYFEMDQWWNVTDWPSIPTHWQPLPQPPEG